MEVQEVSRNQKEKTLNLSKRKNIKGEIYMMKDARDEDFELAEIDNVVVIFTNARIDRDTVPFDLYCYDVRESEGFSGDPVTLEKVVVINHWGTVLSKKPFPLEDDAYYPLKDGINYLGETCTMDEFMEMNPEDEMDVMF